MSAPQDYRQRYIAFRIDQNVPKGGVINIISEIGYEKDFSPSPWLTVYDAEKAEGLIKCDNNQVDRLKSELDKLDSPGFTIMGISGTIKTARQKFLSDC